MAELYDDDDFYGAGCEMDDQLLIVNDSDDNNLLLDNYEQDFLEKQAEYSLGNSNITKEQFSSVKRLSRSSVGSRVSHTSVSSRVSHSSVGDSSAVTVQEIQDYQQLRNRHNLLKDDDDSDNDGQKPPSIYPPERRPPIFDFFTVLTAFIVAVILAYYTISSY